jgi:hypothetical protein
MADRHFIDNHLSFKRMFAQAIRENIVDHADRSKIQPGYFRIRLGGDRPLVAARIYERPPDDGDTPAGEILGKPCDPVEVWAGRDREPLVAPEGYTLEGWYRYLCDDAAWAKVHASSEEPLANPRRKVDLTKISPIGPPNDK